MKKSSLRTITLEVMEMIQNKFPERQVLLQRRLFSSSFWQESQTIGITMSKFPEIETREIIEFAWKCGKKVCVPKVDSGNKVLTFYVISSFSQLKLNRLGIEEPNEDCEVIAVADIDLLVVPGIAFNKKGYRVGYGGGYYDRILKDYNGRTLSLAFSEQFSESFKVEKHDQPVKRIINENGEYEFREVIKGKHSPPLSITNITMGTMVLIFLFMVFIDRSMSLTVETLINFGSLYPNMLENRGFWRLVTAIFLHADLMHISMNMVGLYFLGNAIETIYGKKKWCLIFFASGISSSLLSYFINNNVSVGASGAIFGFLGALLYIVAFGKKPHNINKNNLYFIVVLNLVIGFTSSRNIDNAGHIGGLIGGMLVSFIISEVRELRNR